MKAEGPGRGAERFRRGCPGSLKLRKREKPGWGGFVWVCFFLRKAGGGVSESCGVADASVQPCCTQLSSGLINLKAYKSTSPEKHMFAGGFSLGFGFFVWLVGVFCCFFGVFLD